MLKRVEVCSKAGSVLKSCVTSQQLDIAKRYMNLVWPEGLPDSAQRLIKIKENEIYAINSLINY